MIFLVCTVVGGVILLVLLVGMINYKKRRDRDA